MAQLQKAYRFVTEEVERWNNLLTSLETFEFKTPLQGVLQEFSTFSAAYTNYILQLLEDPPKETTTDWLYTKAVDALRFYWMPIARAAEQYQVKHYRQLLQDGSDKYLQWLNAKTQLGFLPGVLIYFDKLPIARRYPFTRTAFIGVPYQLAEGGEWLAVPHELGHHLYWNVDWSSPGQTGATADPFTQGPELKEAVERHLQNAQWSVPLSDLEKMGLIKMLAAWTEEVFADTVGAVLGGKDFVTSSVEMGKHQVRNLDDRLHHDGAHPPPILRPLVGAYTLRLLNQLADEEWYSFMADFDSAEPSKLQILATVAPEAKPDLLHALNTPEEARQLVTFLQQIQRVPLAVSVVWEGLALVVGYIVSRIQNGLALRYFASVSTGTFDEFLQWAKKKSGLYNAYEDLLEPRVLEGGYTHSHSAGAYCVGSGHAWQWHDASAFTSHSHPD